MAMAWVKAVMKDLGSVALREDGTYALVLHSHDEGHVAQGDENPVRDVGETVKGSNDGMGDEGDLPRLPVVATTQDWERYGEALRLGLSFMRMERCPIADDPEGSVGDFWRGYAAGWNTAQAYVRGDPAAAAGVVALP